MFQTNIIIIITIACSLVWGRGHQQALSSHNGPRPVVAVLPTYLLMSDSRSRRREFLGWPLFLFPWGFQARACLVLLDEDFQTSIIGLNIPTMVGRPDDYLQAWPRSSIWTRVCRKNNFNLVPVRARLKSTPSWFQVRCSKHSATLPPWLWKSL